MTAQRSCSQVAFVPQSYNRAIARLFVTTSALSIACALPSFALHAQGTDHIPLRGTSIAVYNLVGHMRVTGGGSSASANIVRRGRDAAKLKIVTGPIGGRESLRIMYPDDRITITDGKHQHNRTDVRVRNDGTFGDTADARTGKNHSHNNSPNSGRRVRIGGENGGMDASADVEIQIPDGVSLRVNLAAGDIVVRNINGDLAVDAAMANVTINDSKGVLDIDVGSGRMDVTNATGAITLDTGSGDITGRNLNGPSLSVDTGSGSITIDGCSADKMSVETGSGAVRMNGVRGRTLGLDTGSGLVQLGILSNFDLINIDSGSGSVTLTLPANFAASLSVDTGSGGIQTEFPVQISSKSRDQMVGHIGTGGGKLVIETGSGSVRLKKGN